MKYILIGKTAEHSRLNDCPMWRITWYCVDDRTIWEMTVDETYRNWSQWRDFVTGNTWGIYTNIKRTAKTTRAGMQVATADRRPDLVEPLASQDDAHELVQQVNDFHSARENTKPQVKRVKKGNLFNNLFKPLV